jgi:hypothetical protein
MEIPSAAGNSRGAGIRKTELVQARSGLTGLSTREINTFRALIRTPAFRESWTAFWRSRLFIWVIGTVAFLIRGANVHYRTLADPDRISSTLGSVGNVLGAPAVRWDSIFYVQIAEHGYRSLSPTAYFPFYPLLVHVGSWLVLSPIIAGILISCVATLVGLVIVHRLTDRELGPGPARIAVMLVAFAPLSIYLSAVYTEGLFLALSAGTFYAARRGRWWLTGILGGLAAMTRITGVLLFAPALLLYLYGPRDDAEARPRTRSGFVAALRPRYPLEPSALWLGLIPAGLAAFCAYTALRGFGLTATFHSQHLGGHQFTTPFEGIWQGIMAARHHFRQLAVLIVSALALVGVFRRLPPAYGVYVLLGLLIPLSSPSTGDPLRGLPRYASMLFPVFMWAGAWSAGRWFKPLVLGGTILLLTVSTIQFATWHPVL